MAAKVKTTSTSLSYKAKSKTRRPGVHAKTKTSSSKQSKNYAKPYARPSPLHQERTFQYQLFQWTSFAREHA